MGLSEYTGEILATTPPTAVTLGALQSRLLAIDGGGVEEGELPVQANVIAVQTTNFAGQLNGGDTNVQHALDTLDDHGHPAMTIPVDVSDFGGVLGSGDTEVQHALDTLDDHTHVMPADVHAHRRNGASTGRLYTMPVASCSTALADATFTKDIIHAIPFVCPVACTVDALFIEVAGYWGNYNLRVGIYSDSNCYPDAVVFDSGQQVITGTGVKTITPGATVSLSGGSLYWLVRLSSSNSSEKAIYAINQTGMLGFAATLGAARPAGWWSVAQAYGALPGTYPASATAQENAAAPGIFVRLA